MAREKLRLLHSGVYLVGPFDPPHAREMAAVLACGAGATLSHRSAACLYKLLPYPAQPALVDVTVTGRNPGRPTGVQVHRAGSLEAHEVRERSGIPVTSPQRTLLDLTGCCGADELEAAVAEAFALRLTNHTQLVRATAAARGRRGVAKLRVLLDADRDPARTRSPPERVLLAAIRAAGLPEPEVNARVGGWEVDFLWRRAGLVVELDGYSSHSSPRAFERDRRKAAELEDIGLTVRRVSALQVRHELELTLARIRRAL